MEWKGQGIEEEKKGKRREEGKGEMKEEGMGKDESDPPHLSERRCASSHYTDDSHSNCIPASTR